MTHSRLPLAFTLWLVLSCWLVTSPLAAQSVEHPLDPLSFREYWAVLEVLQQAGHVNPDTRFSIVNLREPPKELVWKWSKGTAIPREASALVRKGPETYEAIVDVAARRLVSWTQLRDMQPNWLAEESRRDDGRGEEAPCVRRGAEEAGHHRLHVLECSALPPGYFGTPTNSVDSASRTLTAPIARGVRNTWTRGISQGLPQSSISTAKQVLRVVDEGAVPMPATTADYDAASIGTPRQVPSAAARRSAARPRLSSRSATWSSGRDGAFTSDPTSGRHGHLDRHLRRRRPAAVRCSIRAASPRSSCPYMDPAFTWYQRNFLDAGEFNAGGLAKPLAAAASTARNMPSTSTVSSPEIDGRPRTVSNVFCLFERETGDMAWRHFGEEPESRRRRDLVVRSAAVLGNYDYVFDWTFQQDGSIKVAVGATGITEVKATVAATAKDQPSGSGHGRHSRPKPQTPTDASSTSMSSPSTTITTSISASTSTWMAPPTASLPIGS